MKVFAEYLIFVVIGVIPEALADYSINDLQWWATCIPLWIAIWLRDNYGMNSNATNPALNGEWSEA